MKTAIYHLRARFPGLYAPRSAAAAATAPVAPDLTTERLFKEAAAAAAAAVKNAAEARVGWTHLGSPNPVSGESTPVPLVL